MRTILVSGSGTGVGKTRVMAALARTARHHGLTAQLIKPVQTGLDAGEPTDADIAAGLAKMTRQDAFTLRTYPAALAPLAAAQEADSELDTAGIVNELLALPHADLRLIEGAGGVAVPLGPEGWDWVNFAMEIRVDAVILVVPDELGAINQSRLVYQYFTAKCPEQLPAGVFLNALQTASPDVCYSTRVALSDTGVPLWGELALNALAPSLHAPLNAWMGE